MNDLPWNYDRYFDPPQEEEKEYYCPVCGAICDKVYRNKEGEILGCDECVEAVDAWEALDE